MHGGSVVLDAGVGLPLDGECDDLEAAPTRFVQHKQREFAIASDEAERAVGGYRLAIGRLGRAQTGSPRSRPRLITTPLLEERMKSTRRRTSSFANSASRRSRACETVSFDCCRMRNA